MPEHLAGADRVDRLLRVPAGLRRRDAAVDEAEDAVLLVVVQLLPQDGIASSAPRVHVDHRPHVRHREEADREDDQRQQDGGAEVGLDRDQDDRDDEQRRSREREHRAACSATARRPENSRASTRITISFDQLGRLDAHAADVEPAIRRAVGVGVGGPPSEARDDAAAAIAMPSPTHASADQRAVVDRPSRRRKPIAPTIIHCDLRVELRVVADAARRRVEVEQADRAEREHREDQRPVDRGAEPAPARDADRGARQLRPMPFIGVPPSRAGMSRDRRAVAVDLREVALEDLLRDRPRDACRRRRRARRARRSRSRDPRPAPSPRTTRAPRSGSSFSRSRVLARPCGAS